jgi:hypothetical protein
MLLTFIIGGALVVMLVSAVVLLFLRPGPKEPRSYDLTQRKRPVRHYTKPATQLPPDEIRRLSVAEVASLTTRERDDMKQKKAPPQ